MNFSIYEYYTMVKEFDINIIYSGPIWSDGIESIAGTVKKRLQFDEKSITASKSVYSVFVELMNNILYYSSEKKTFFNKDDKSVEASAGVFILGTRGRAYFLMSGNVMRDGDIELVKERLDLLNTMDSAELKSLYKEQLRGDNNNPLSKGAGIGLTEIARRASSKIEYEFTPLGDGTSFFSMSVTIGGER